MAAVGNRTRAQPHQCTALRGSSAPRNDSAETRPAGLRFRNIKTFYETRPENGRGALSPLYKCIIRAVRASRGRRTPRAV